MYENEVVVKVLVDMLALFVVEVAKNGNLYFPTR
jgi:hypothetical protein